MPSLPISLGRKPMVAAIVTYLIAGVGAVQAETAPHYRLEISDKGFAPATVTIPAGKKVQLEVRNLRKLPSEFESYPLNREKLVPAGSTTQIWVGPLTPGHYQFFDDFNPGKTGTVIVEGSAGNASHAQ